MDPTISVVIPTRDRSRVLARCLRALASQVGVQLRQVIVVDDGSTDGTRGVVMNAGAPFGERFAYIPSEGRGLNAARNTGARNTDSEAIVFIDDDAVAPPNWAAALTAALSRYPDAVAVGGGVVERLEGGRRPIYWCAHCSTTDAHFIPGAQEGPVPVLGGANMALRSEALSSIVGHFDERLSGWGDDRDWYRRAAAVGARVVYAPDAFVWHVRPVSDARLVGRTRRAFRRGREAREYYRLVQEPIPLRASMSHIPRYLGHSVTHGCIFGIVAVAGAAGLATGGAGHVIEIARRPPVDPVAS